MGLARRSGSVLLFAVVAGAPGAVSADLVYLTNGRAFSVKEYRVEGSTATLVLRNGGEIQCDASLVARVEPDEVPYPEPLAPAPPVAIGGPTGGPFAELIEPLAVQHRVDAALVRAVVETESSYRPTARSPKGAMGLMQLMPATALRYAVRDPYDPKANLDAGIRHLRMLLDRYEIAVALAAYNAGEGAVQRYGGIPPYRETRDYVSRVLRLAGLDRRAGL
jgi:soluble lytic murein transglycosylase-like protein